MIPSGVEITREVLALGSPGAAERTIHGLWNAIGRIIDLYSPQKCANYFAHCGYDAD